MWPAAPRRGPVAHRLTGRLEGASWLDAPSKALAGAVDRALGPGRAKDTLSGTWLGHPLHPVLTDVPIGAWTSVAALDVLGGERARDGDDALVALGVLAAAPAMAAGLADWADTIGAERRVGFAHAAANTTALVMYIASWVARRTGRRGVGVALGLAGAATVAAGGYLGGHLSFASGVGVDNTAFQAPPDDWTPVGAEAQTAADGRPQYSQAGDVGVLVSRQEGRLCAIAATCTHAGGPLEDGTVREGQVVCPWHGSVFRLGDGHVVRGPATSAQPTFDVRVRDGQVEVRAPRS
jgi:nitrite reductase/ring-hydroxylating ferredoxin subunit/uncharacterized membrane protein